MADIYTRLRPVASNLIDTFKNPSPALIQTETLTDDGYGGKESSWATTATIDKAVLIPASASEREQAHRLQTEVSHKFIIEYNSALVVSSKSRISFKNRIFNVVYPKDVAEGGIIYVIMCMEGVAT